MLFRPSPPDTSLQHLVWKKTRHLLNLNYDNYFEFCLELVRPGAIIAIDNVFWGGWVAEDSQQDDDTKAIRALNKKLKTDERIELSIVPIGDGLTLARKL